MITKVIQGTLLISIASLFFISTSFAGNTFDRELVVKDQTRIMKVESVFKKLLQAYEDENAREFLDIVSDDRFRQDYITFTDALYSDFRKYDIHQVDYWIDRVVSDHIKQFLYVKWEKRTERIDDGRQETQRGFSRFLFDEVNGKYLLIELAGNTLFGGSLQEWREETPPISGQVLKKRPTVTTGSVTDNNVTKGTDIDVAVECSDSSLGACDQFNCASSGYGYWDDNTSKCYPSAQEACSAKAGTWDGGECYGSAQEICTAKDGYWQDEKCYTSEEEACEAGHWYNNRCNEMLPQPDLTIVKIDKVTVDASSPELAITIQNIGDAISGSYSIDISFLGGSSTKYGEPLSPNGKAKFGIPGNSYYPPIEITVTQTSGTPEKTTDNNTETFMPY